MFNFCDRSLIEESSLELQYIMDIFEKKKGNVVLINTGIYLRTLSLVYGKRLFSMGKETLNKNVVAMGVPKRSPLLEAINKK